MINVAVVGYGYWGPQLVRNFQGLSSARVAVCCDSNPARLTEVAARYPGVETATDYQAVLRDPRVDAVVVATPIQTHYAFARKALEHDKHVLVEKPIAASVSEAESLVELAAKRGLRLMVDHTFIYTGAVRKMKEIVERGDLGELYYMDSVRINLGLFQRDVNVLWDLAPHDLAIMDHLIAEQPVSVCANGACHLGNGVENVAYLTVYFNSGLIAHFHNNWLAPVKVRTVLLGGSKRMILYDDMETSEKIKVYDRGVDVSSPEGVRDALINYRLGDMWAPRLDQAEALSCMAGEFVDAIAAVRAPLTDGRSGLNVVRILEAAEMSIKRRGREVKL
ncbi:MAG: Gfo/Idh/MocA family protein [Candidatus Methylomirabilales bacterium]